MINQISNQTQFYNNLNTKNSKNSTSFEEVFTLKLHDENGNKALTSTTLADGGSASVFAEASDDEYIVKAWDKNGTKREFSVKTSEVNPNNASYFEMLAFATNSDENGLTNNALRDFISSAAGAREQNSFSFNDIERKMDFKALLKELMDMQKANNTDLYKQMLEFYNIM